MKYLSHEINRLGNRLKNQDRSDLIRNDYGLLMVVSDGMGGRPCGEQAAMIVVQQAHHAYRQATGAIRQPAAFFELVLHTAHQKILHLCEQKQIDQIPGATAVLVLVERNRVWWAHVGDSRFYLLRKGQVVVRTTDHSYVEYLYRKGEISREQMANHPQRNALTRCVGCARTPPVIEIGEGMPLQVGDRLLLCTDGLWDGFDDATIGKLLGQHEVLATACDQLAEKAEQRGYPNSDNITLVAFEFKAADTHHSPDSITPDQAGSIPKQRLEEAIEQIHRALEQYGDQIS